MTRSVCSFSASNAVFQRIHLINSIQAIQKMDHFDLLTIHIFKDPRVLIPDYRVCKLSVRKHNGDLLLTENFFFTLRCSQRHQLSDYVQ